MKKILSLIALVIFFALIYFGEKRDFYCLEEGKCVTVWKTYGNSCYIIPYKYYGLLSPSGNYIKTTYTNDVTIYWNDELPNAVTIRCEQDFKIVNNNSAKINIVDFNSNYENNLNKVFYDKDAKGFSDVKKNVSFISIYIKENYATDKNGNKLR
ncbi:MAG: hypothetical protein JST23_08190 [Bacteroidetes bacterium]|nr:hypothetical protein [Bacteroidota bacterium]